MTTTQAEEQLAVGLLTVVTVSPKSAIAKTFKTSIRGWDLHKYVLLDWPANLDSINTVHPKQSCQVKFLCDGNAFAWLGEILDPGSPRDPRIRISWPTDLQAVRLRKRERVSVDVPCAVADPAGNTHHAKLRDISPEGCGFISTIGCAVGQQLRISFDLSNCPPFRDLPAAVRNIRVQENDQIIGCQFPDLEQETFFDLRFFTENAVNTENARGDRIRVLLVESDLVLLKRAERIVETAGFEPILARDVVDAFHMLNLRHPDIIVMSHDVPYLPCPEVCRAIRGSRGHNNIPVLVFGVNNTVQRDSALQAGAAAYFSNIDETPEQVREALAKTNTK